MTPWVVIEVEDNGVGMDEQVRNLAFEPFFTTKESGQGTGLGLSTVFGIVRQTDGHVELASEPSKGTTITLYFLAADVSLADPAPIAAERSAEDIDARVLVLEDDPLARKLIVRSLERAGLDAVACEDGDAAVEKLAEDAQHYDILCSDAVFPGAPLSKVIKTFQEHSPGAPVLVCSGYIREEIAISGVESGEWEFLAKPFTNRQFIDKVRSMLAAAEVRDAES